MAEREHLIAQFLAAHGWDGARRAALAGDASFRRYQRLSLGGRTAVLMDAPPDKEDVRPFLAVARRLRGFGYSAPEVLAAEPERGLVLIEDLGDDKFTRLLENGAVEEHLYGAAVDLLVDLHRRAPPPELPPYDERRLLDEADLFVDWYLPALDGDETTAEARRDYEGLWREVLPQARRGPEVMVLRDYHADNLIWLAGREALARVGLLDFQDAVRGPAAYDLVSLLEDARRDVAPGCAGRMIARYLAAAESDAAGFRTAYAVLGAQRNAKIIGIFTRLWRRDGKAAYLDLIPRVWGLLEGDLAHPALAPLADWFARRVAPERRRRPLPGAPS